MQKNAQVKACPQCGAEIPAQAPQGLCPACLLAQVSAPTEAGAEAKGKPAPPSLEELTAAFPHLEILEMIGQGGMGFVFKARQPKLERLVALKILPHTLAADAAFAERFTQEGRVLARLSHPNIVTVHDFGQANGFFYLLMEYVDGVNLRQAMKAGRFTPEQALAVVPKICDALEFAHGEGILHRDIKPENILLDAKGRVKIADFGIAKILGQSGGRLSQLTVADQQNVTGVIGTPQYMAPEQLEKPRQVDQRADIYSLGVVFYEMLTGELPLGRFAPPSEKVSLDPRLDEVVLRALEKEPNRRTPTAGEVRTQVETITGSVPVASAPADARNLGLPAAPKRSFARPLGRGVVAGALTLVVCALGILLVTQILPRTYVASARVAVDPANPSGRFDPFRLQTQFELIQSEKCLLRAAHALDLQNRWAAKLGIQPPVHEAQLVERLRSTLQVRQSRNTGLFEIMFYSDEPGEAAEVANAIAQAYCAVTVPVEARIVNQAVPVTTQVRPPLRLIFFLGGLAAVGAAIVTTIAVALYFFLKRDQPPAAATPPPGPTEAAPLAGWVRGALVVVSAGFILSGISSIWSVVSDLAKSTYNFNPGVLALPVGIGLLRSRPWWRRTALALLGLMFVVFVVAAPFLSGAGGHAYALTKVGNHTYPMAESSALVFIAICLAVLVLVLAFLLRRDVKGRFARSGFNRPWIEWSALVGAFCLALLAQEWLPKSVAETPGPSVNAVVALPSPHPEGTKSIQLTEITLTQGDRLSAWTDSPFPPGEAVVAVMRHPDGRTEDSGTQTMTVRGERRPQVTTVFSWKIPKSFASEAIERARGRIEEGFRGRPLRLPSGETIELFALTNSAGGVLSGGLAFRPVPSSEIAPDAQARVRFSSATNVQQMVLAYFNSSIPDGCVLQAAASESGAAEPPVHTSISKSSTFDNGNIRWDFPGSFTAKEMTAAAEQIDRRKNQTITVPIGQRTELFSVTNRTGTVYAGYFELLAPAGALASETSLSSLSPEELELARLKVEFAAENPHAR